jgi:ubiquitin carboxyl-terminal hydrolase 7
MVEPLKPKQSLKIAELQDGDIIVFQQAREIKADGAADQRSSQEV